MLMIVPQVGRDVAHLIYVVLLVVVAILLFSRLSNSNLVLKMSDAGLVLLCAHVPDLLLTKSRLQLRMWTTMMH